MKEGRELRQPYFTNRNQTAPKEAHISTEMRTESVMSFAHSKVDTVLALFQSALSP
jgi:hypothetical protein